jgi:uncharacterized Tic20 family protein
MTEERPQPEPASPPIPDAVAAPQLPATSEERLLAAIAHFGGIFGGFVVPLVIWLIKKDQSKFIDDQAKEALNFQINIVGQAVILMIVTLVTCGFGGVLYLPWLLWPLIMSILAGVAANKGELYRYPATIRLIK